MANLIVGDVVEVGRECLSNPPGMRAVVVELYEIAPRRGWHLLFENGESDGFSEDDLEAWQVLYVRHEPSLADYTFRNVNQVFQDWRRGLFAAAWPKPKAAAHA